MIALIQRVKNSFVIRQATGEEIARIGKGLLVFLGVKKGDSETNAVALAKKIPSLRIFEDQQGKMNLSLFEVKGEILVVSQFTLYADTKKGNRPSFSEAAEKEKAFALYEKFLHHLRYQGVPTKSGIFGESMLVVIENDGPVTLILEE
ncbi:MAG: D-aminoacyl-tRNA deacylase [candidate division WOR-3 bacterium]